MSEHLDDEDALAGLPTVVDHDWKDFPVDALVDALARKIWTTREIAARFSLTMPQLHEIVSRPPVLKAIKLKRMLWESDANAQERLMHFAQIGLIEALPSTFAIAHNAEAPMATRLDVIKTMTRLAGFDGRASGKDAQMGPTAAQFAVNIIFKGAGLMEKISATVVDAEVEDAA